MTIIIKEIFENKKGIQTGATVLLDGAIGYMTLRKLVVLNGCIENAVFLHDAETSLMRLRLLDELAYK